MTDKQGETADAEVGDDFKYDQARVLLGGMIISDQLIAKVQHVSQRTHQWIRANLIANSGNHG